MLNNYTLTGAKVETLATPEMKKNDRIEQIPSIVIGSRLLVLLLIVLDSFDWGISYF